MPLKISQDAPATIEASLKSKATASQPTFLVVYASIKDGKMWCGDCRSADPLVVKYLGSKPEDVTVVYAGKKAE